MQDRFHRLDKHWVRTAFNKAAAGFDNAAVLQREVAERLLERLKLVRLTPASIVDAGCGTGVAAAKLLAMYRKGRLIGVDVAPAMLAIARKRKPWLRTLHCVAGDAESLPLADHCCDLLFSSFALPWCNDLGQTFDEFIRVLKPGGLLMFSTLGPDTLTELRKSWAAVDSYSHVNAFIDMHDIGDALLRTGFADPVMDMEYFTLTYKNVQALIDDLQATGSCNATAGRPRGLTGKGRLQAMLQAYERYRCDGLLPATFEVVYGHAWKPDKPLARRRDDGSAIFPLAQLRRGRGGRDRV